MHLNNLEQYFKTNSINEIDDFEQFFDLQGKSNDCYKQTPLFYILFNPNCKIILNDDQILHILKNTDLKKTILFNNAPWNYLSTYLLQRNYKYSDNVLSKKNFDYLLKNSDLNFGLGIGSARLLECIVSLSFGTELSLINKILDSNHMEYIIKNTSLNKCSKYQISIDFSRLINSTNYLHNIYSYEVLEYLHNIYLEENKKETNICFIEKDKYNIFIDYLQEIKAEYEKNILNNILPKDIKEKSIKNKI